MHLSFLMVIDNSSSWHNPPTSSYDPAGGGALYPDSKWKRAIYPRVNTLPTDITRYHKIFNQGMDIYHWGTNKVHLDMSTGEEVTRKASWMDYLWTYNKWERQRREEGRYKRRYTKKHRIQHLTGECVDFFCGVAPSKGEHWQWIALDGDYRGEDFKKLDELVGRLLPALISEPSTGGRGTHRICKVNFWRRYGKSTDQEMHDWVVSMSSRLKKATQALSSASSLPIKERSCFEVKGACCYWDNERVDEKGIKGSYVMGTLCRMPVRLSASELESLPVMRQEAFEKFVEQVEGMAFPGLSSQGGSEGEQEEKAARKAKSVAAVGNAGSYSPDRCGDAFQRMIHAKCEFVRLAKALPDSPETLCNFYEAQGLATGDRTDARLERAAAVLSHAEKIWEDRGTGPVVECDPLILAGRTSELEQLIPRANIKAFKFKCGVKYQELAAYEIIVSELMVQGGFAARDVIMRIMNAWHEEGHLPHLLDNHKLAAFRKVLLSERVLEIEKAHRPPGEVEGRAAAYRPTKKGFGREEWEARKAKELAELAASVQIEDEDLETADEVTIPDDEVDVIVDATTVDMRDLTDESEMYSMSINKEHYSDEYDQAPDDT